MAVTAVFLAYSIDFKLPGYELIRRLENIAYDMKLNMTMPGGVDQRIVIVDIDEKSLQALGQWPWPRTTMARIVDRLFSHYQINVLGFDIVFAEKDISSGLAVLEKLAREDLRDIPEFAESLARLRPRLQNDRIFASSLKNRNVVMGFLFDHTSGNQKGKLPPSDMEAGGKWQNQFPLFKPEGYVANLPILQSNALSGGFFDSPKVDHDGVLRRIPLFQIHNDKLYPSLGLAVAKTYLDFPKTNIIVTSTGRDQHDYNSIEYFEMGERRIRVNPDLSALIPYRGPQFSYPYVSAIDVLNKKVDIEKLKDKIVLVGSSAPGLMDLRSTPVQNTYAGVEVHANLVAGILDESFKHEPLYIKGYEWMGVVLIGIIMTVLIPYLSPLWASALPVGLLLAIGGLNMLAWDSNVVLPFIKYLLLITILFILQMCYGYFVESRNKRVLSKVFGQYIPPELVDELDKDSKDINLSGESREMTVLFSDVRNFTSISEGLNPVELSMLMNEFLTPMTAIIHKHRGTIDKYMGDAIMAFWGAPLGDTYHRKNALLASMEMIEVINARQAEFKARGWPELKIGIGINSGTMNVGNMGSEFRMAYTVLGDSVNLGSRLEGLTKKYGVDIIVGESLKKSLSEFEFLELDRVRVKGKKQPVTIYEPLGFSIELDKEQRMQAKRFRRALQSYREQKWDAAEREILSLSQMNPEKLIYKIYLDRIMKLRNQPPGEQWDGVFEHSAK